MKCKSVIGIIAVIYLHILILPIRADELKSTVLENPYNRLAAQLDNKGQELSRREMALDALEAKLEKSYIKVMGLVGLLFLLIILNFVFDYRRRKSLIVNK
jgi:hypothetical protein